MATKTRSSSVASGHPEKTAGGKIVRLAREDDNDGRWNYEVVVKSEGKESGFEVAPNGDFVRQHDVAQR